MPCPQECRLLMMMRISMLTVTATATTNHPRSTSGMDQGHQLLNHVHLCQLGPPKPLQHRMGTQTPRLSVVVSPRGPGSAENPIHVDEIASLFEPIVIREYVWTLSLPFAHADNTLQVKEEEISPPLKANPPIKGNRSYTAFDVTGTPRS